MARENDEVFRMRCEQEIKAQTQWPNKWGWILDENKEKNKTLNLTKEKDYKNIDTRSLPPFPITTSREIGWLSSKPEFQLEIYGPDIMPIGKETKLQKL